MPKKHQQELLKSASFPKNNNKIHKFPNANLQIEKSSKASNNNKPRFKSIIEPRKFFQPYKIIGGEGEENAEFKHPLGVAVSPIDGFIYVADSWNNRIQVDVRLLIYCSNLILIFLINIL